MTVATCLALTWLNPHVYLDTVVLLGSMASTYGEHRWQFAAGAGLGSVVWFAGLGYGARLLRPVFARPAAWRVLDGGIAVVMCALAVSLAVRGVAGGVEVSGRCGRGSARRAWRRRRACASLSRCCRAVRRRVRGARWRCRPDTRP